MVALVVVRVAVLVPAVATVVMVAAALVTVQHEFSDREQERAKRILGRWYGKKHHLYCYERLSTCMQILLPYRKER